MKPTDVVDQSSLRDDVPDFAPGDTLKVHVRVVEVATQRLEEDEHSIATRYESVLQLLLPPDQMPVVQTYFTTESIPDAYEAHPHIPYGADAPQRCGVQLGSR